MAAERLAGPLASGRASGRVWLALGGLNGAIAVGILAATAHGRIAGGGAELAEIGARFELMHAILLVALSAAVRIWTSRLLDLAAALTAAGCLLFSGGLYLDALTATGAFLVPIGGLCFILGWLSLAGAALAERISP
jgi:uncharacterized membrane protein YgdD (TMEM256/DUF423 family)